MSLSSVLPEVGPVAWPAEYWTSWPIFSSSVIFPKSSFTFLSRVGDSSALDDATFALALGTADCARKASGNKAPSAHDKTNEKIEAQLRARTTLSRTFNHLRGFMTEMIAPLRI